MTYKRLLQLPNQSFFLFGPRGTGKTSWVKKNIPDSLYFDLLESDLYLDFLARPSLLEKQIPHGFNGWIIIDEIQKIPKLLDEVHRLIESFEYRFILTGSSARSLRKKGVNLLAGRALTSRMYPLTCKELGDDFALNTSLQYGNLPSIYKKNIDRDKYLESYVQTYLREEVLQEGLTRNLGAFTRFLETASFSQGSVLNLTEIAREAKVNRKVIENYFTIIEDLLLGYRIPVFTKHAKRKIIAHPKFYFFDAGIFRILRPKGPLDIDEQIGGIALETLVFQELLAINSYFSLGYHLFYWRTASQLEVDFILYGPKGLLAIEVKRSSHFSSKDLQGLKAFKSDYPAANCYFFYGGDIKRKEDEIQVIPISEAFRLLPSLLSLES